MKKIILIASLLFSTNAFSMRVTEAELRTLNLCSMRFCHGNDGGRSFTIQCNFEARYPELITVLMKNYNGQICYCPCTLEYLMGEDN